MTLRDAKRICNAHEHCADCPFMTFMSRGGGMCVINNVVPSGWDISGVREAAEKWLKEHPEPIYPTYYNWLTSEGVINCLGDRISPEFAEKYGIEPIKDVSNVER